MTQPSAEWRSGQRVGLITQRSQDRNLAPLGYGHTRTHPRRGLLPTPMQTRLLQPLHFLSWPPANPSRCKEPPGFVDNWQHEPQL